MPPTMQPTYDGPSVIPEAPVIRRWSALLVAAALAAALVSGVVVADRSGTGRSSGVSHSALPAKASIARAQSAYGRLPMRFEANRGQTDRRVRFLARGAGYTLFLTPGETVLSLSSTHASRPARTLSAAKSTPRSTSAVLRTRLLGANPHPRIEGLDPLPGTTNYLTARTQSHVPGYGRVLYRGVYPGVDLIYYGRQGRLEHDYRVAPGSDPRAIRLGVRGARRMSLDRSGNLVMATAAGPVRQLRPVAYQSVAGQRRAVAARYVLNGDGRVGFALGRYDRSRALVIDPVLAYSTYLGGALGGDTASVIAVDSSGAAYVAGGTTAVDFPTLNAFQATRKGDPNDAQDAFVTKLSPAGNTLVYSTYLGGDSNDQAGGIALDSSGRAYVTGVTHSSNFPVTSKAYQATAPAGGTGAFLSVLKADGTGLDYSTYLGGNSYTEGDGVAVDSAGNAYVTGLTNATDFPTKAPSPATPFQSSTSGNGASFVAKLDPGASTAANSLVYATYLGGSGGDQGASIAVDGAGEAYVAGYTYSTDFPTHNPFQAAPGGNGDGFVAKLNPTGSALAYSTYLGGAASDVALAIALDPSGHAYVAGQTLSTDFPTLNAFQPKHAGDPAKDFTNDAFVAKLDTTASGNSSLVYSSYLGGVNEDEGTGIAVTPSGTAYVAGVADASSGPAAPGGFPTVDPVAPAATGGDAFVAAVRPDGSGLAFSTYLGGGGQETVGALVPAGGLALDPSGNAYVTGNTYSTDFPTHNPFQTENLAHGAGDHQQTFVAKLAPVASAAAPLVTGLGRRSGPAGISVTIFGHGFTGARAVHFGTAAASGFTVDSDTQITATVPPGPSGPVAVVVATPQGDSPANPIATFTNAVGTWDLTGSMVVGRSGAQATTMLSDGRVLVAGGIGPRGPLADAELYDPASGRWIAIQSMRTARSNFTATLLPDGRVLVAGGQDQNGQPIASAELYDPTNGTWTATTPLAQKRQEHTATLLPSGKVLVAGGSDATFTASNTTELYDPAAATWSPAHSMVKARAGHSATPLSNGKVLIIGGASPSSAEIYDPATDAWAATGSPGDVSGPATRLADGRVLVAGVNAANGSQSASAAVIYDPTTGLFSPTSAPAYRREAPAATLLSDGRVLVAGGADDGTSKHNTAEVYDPATGQWTSAGVMNHYRGSSDTRPPEAFAVTLLSGKVLVGGDSASAGATTELYNPAAPGLPSPGPGPGPGPTGIPGIPPPGTPGGPAGSKPGPAVRLPQANLPGLRLSARRRVRGRRTIFVIRGSLRLPASIPASRRASVCHGLVTVAVRRGHKTGASRTVRLRKDCSFSVTITVATSKLGHRGRYNIRVRFHGNANLNARSQTTNIR